MSDARLGQALEVAEVRFAALERALIQRHGPMLAEFVAHPGARGRLYMICLN